MKKRHLIAASVLSSLTLAPTALAVPDFTDIDNYGVNKTKYYGIVKMMDEDTGEDFNSFHKEQKRYGKSQYTCLFLLNTLSGGGGGSLGRSNKTLNVLITKMKTSAYYPNGSNNPSKDYLKRFMRGTETKVLAREAVKTRRSSKAYTLIKKRIPVYNPSLTAKSIILTKDKGRDNLASAIQIGFFPYFDGWVSTFGYGKLPQYVLNYIPNPVDPKLPGVTKINRSSYIQCHVIDNTYNKKIQNSLENLLDAFGRGFEVPFTILEKVLGEKARRSI